jgi:hypothetical protein
MTRREELGLCPVVEKICPQYICRTNQQHLSHLLVFLFIDHTRFGLHEAIFGAEISTNWFEACHLTSQPVCKVSIAVPY